MFGSDYFNSSGSPIIYCTPDPMLISAIKKAALQVIELYNS